MKKVVLLLIIHFLSLNTKAQKPAHFILGESELANINIYDLTQDQEGNYWLATDQGIIKYDGYHFKPIKNQSIMGTSVFALTFDNNQNLYCNNLSGQILKITEDRCSVYFQIPDSLMSSEIYFEFDNENNLIIATNNLFKVSSLGKIELLFPYKSTDNRFSILFKKTDSSVITFSHYTNELVQIKSGKKAAEKFNYINNFYTPLQFLYLGDSLYFYDKLSSRILDTSSKIKKFLPSFIPNKKEGQYRFYTDNNTLFVALPIGGMLLFDQHFRPLLNGNVIFKNEIISSFHKDTEGNLLFGTFKGGIIAIPNIDLIDIDPGEQDAKFTHITSGSNRIFVGTQDGSVLEIDNNKVSVFRKKQIKSIEGIKYIKPTNELLVDESFPLLINLKSKQEQLQIIGAIKDIESIADSAYLIATNTGVYFYNPLGLPILKAYHMSLMTGLKSTYSLNKFEGRTNAVGFDIESKTIFTATPLGLKIQHEYFKLNDLPIIAYDIQYSDGKVYVATQNDGLLIFENKELKLQWTKDSGLLSNTIHQIKIYNHQIFISSNNGFQVLSMDGKVLHTLKPSDGLHNFAVIDFEINNNTLWLVQQKGIQKINIDKLKSITLKPQIKLNWVIQGADTINFLKKGNFNHEQSKFEFQVSSNTLKYQDELEYHYQLSGIDQQWQVSPYKNNTISFLSLPAGNCKFSVKAVLRNQESETISYKFTIAPPYWNTWWFYTLSVLVVLAVSGGIFSSFYIRQRKKIQFQNELNNSKLSAIQSQMNPHFIFNALNSIQDFIVLNEKKMAGKYLGKFADLMRIYLNHSQIKTVSLREEIDALELYLELEKLRFNTLDFSIEVDTIIDENLVTIPTLLIQPYIENALKHGLLHRKDDKKLSVSFKLITEHDLIECEIIDNGIGRAASAQVNKMRNPNHQSFATKATKNRLELLNFGHKKPIGEQIIDLVDENGRALGTKVVLRIPILN